MKVLNGYSVMLAVTLALAGCSALTIGESQFTCERSEVRNAPGGVPTACTGVREVYKATNKLDRLPDPLQAAKASDSSKPSGLASEVLPSAVVHLPQPITRPQPIMEPAQVARIWINYWIDSKGDLHQPGLIYTEITPRRWAVGQPARTATRDLQPLQMMQPQLEEDGGSTVTAVPSPSAQQRAPQRR